MSKLDSQVKALAHSFAASILAAIRGGPLAELVLEHENPRVGRTNTIQAGGAPAGNIDRLARRSAKEVAEALVRVVDYVKQHKEGRRAEQIREALNMERRAMPRILQEGLRTKQLTSKGVKRSTTYFAVHSAQRREPRAAQQSRAAESASRSSRRRSTKDGTNVSE